MTASTAAAPPRTDLELILAIGEQDAASFAELYDRYRTLAYALALRVVHDQQRAEDVVHDAFLSIWRRAGSYAPGRGSVRTWLTSVVRNRAIDVLRARRETTGDDGPTLLGIRDPRPPVEDQVVSALEGQLLRAVLAELPQEQRDAIGLAFFAGQTHAEIADLTQIPLGTVKSRIRLGMQRLRGGLSSRNAW